MPAPAAASSFTSTGTAPVITLTWTHAGTNLHRFEVLYKPAGETAWIPWILAPAADFLVSGTNYRCDVASADGTQWVVRGLSSAGEVSTTNPTVTVS